MKGSPAILRLLRITCRYHGGRLRDLCQLAGGQTACDCQLGFAVRFLGRFNGVEDGAFDFLLHHRQSDVVTTRHQDEIVVVLLVAALFADVVDVQPVAVTSVLLPLADELGAVLVDADAERVTHVFFPRTLAQLVAVAFDRIGEVGPLEVVHDHLENADRRPENVKNNKMHKNFFSYLVSHSN